MDFPEVKESIKILHISGKFQSYNLVYANVQYSLFFKGQLIFFYKFG